VLKEREYTRFKKILTANFVVIPPPHHALHAVLGSSNCADRYYIHKVLLRINKRFPVLSATAHRKHLIFSTFNNIITKSANLLKCNQFVAIFSSLH